VDDVENKSLDFSEKKVIAFMVKNGVVGELFLEVDAVVLELTL
jgi:hypothetical protein